MSLADRVGAMLDPDGKLARRWPRFERRDEQLRLARRIAEFAEHGGVLLAEAPTGLGKSLAYLLPGVLLAAEGRRVVVATCTRSLQDQLFERDVPALLDAIGVTIPYARLKGKQNYVCPVALEGAEGRGAEEDATLEQLRRWAGGDAEGDLDRFPADDAEAFRRVRPRVAADATACTSATCRRGRECPWVRARRVAAQAPLVIVNHALLALAGEVEGLIPDFEVLVVDEAHRLEGVLLQQLERHVSHGRFEELLRALGSAREGRGAAARGTGLAGRLARYVAPLLEGGERAEASLEALDRLERAAVTCREGAAALFERVDGRGASPSVYAARRRYASATELFGPDLAPLESVLESLRVVARALQRFGGDLAVSDSPAALELSAELEQLAGRFGALLFDLENVGLAASADWVYWRTTGARGLELHGAPVSVGAHARRLVLARPRAAVLTSATLSAENDFAFMAERLGLGEEWGVPFETTRHPSPFDLASQMRCYVHDPGPDEAEGIAKVVASLAATGKNQLVLFTAHERLRRAREHLRRRLPDHPTLLAQEWDGPAGALAERFRRERGAILLGVQSLWEGVDFPGDALEILVMAKLPFSVPDDPLVEARGERLRDRGLDPFRDDAVPEAVLRFRQGVGRLIRRADDRGVLVICDARMRTASYRRAFLEALPASPEHRPDAAALASEAARFLATEVVMEDPA